MPAAAPRFWQKKRKNMQLGARRCKRGRTPKRILRHRLFRSE
uniref:Orf91 n=1 Tax=Serratia marcescens TaxID=615 RepID=A0A7S7BTV0_SERMA|nr:Orf91 [Serratia marcescens]